MKVTLIRALLIASLAGLLQAHSRAESVIVQWEKIYNGPGNGGDTPSDVAADGEGNVFVTGYSTNASGNSDYYTVKYAAADGALLWEKRYDGPGNLVNREDAAFALAVDGAGNAIVTGSSRPAGPSARSDIYTAKYAALDGALLWERRYNGPASGEDAAWAVEVDSGGNVILTGRSSRAQFTENDYDYYTAKYSAADGRLLWEKPYDSTGHDIARALVLDGAGNAIVTGDIGYSIGGVFYRDAYKVKYAATHGALLWERRHQYNALGNNLEISVDVAVDNEGNVFVTGLSPASGGNFDYYTAKYAAADGSLLWESRYNSTGNGDDRPRRVGVDSAGNVIVTGTSPGVGGNSDFYTAKYAGADGALLWEKRYNGTGNGDDQPRDLVVDGAGNSFVFGTSLGIDGGYEFYTAKYAAANGTLLWEKRYDGPRSASAFSSTFDGLALTPDGGAVVTGNSTNGPNSDYYTVKYLPADLDLDDDGLLDSWEIAHYGSTAGQGALDDTDCDGVVELLELAFGTDPRKPGGSAGPAVIVENGYLTTTIAKQSGVTYLVQTSATPGAGFSATSTTVLTNTMTSLKVRDNVPVGTQPERFLWVRVTAAPCGSADP